MNIQKSNSFPSVPSATFLTAVKMSSFAYVAYKSSIELHKKDFPQVIEIDGERFSIHTAALLKRYTGVEHISCETYVAIYYPMIDGKEDTDTNSERLKLALSRARTDSVITSAISSVDFDGDIVTMTYPNMQT